MISGPVTIPKEIVIQQVEAFTKVEREGIKLWAERRNQSRADCTMGRKKLLNGSNNYTMGRENLMTQ
jgi:hypothetical protein